MVRRVGIGTLEQVARGGTHNAAWIGLPPAACQEGTPAGQRPGLYSRCLPGPNQLSLSSDPGAVTFRWGVAPLQSCPHMRSSTRLGETVTFSFWAALLVVAVVATTRIVIREVALPDNQIHLVFTSTEASQSLIWYSPGDAGWDAQHRLGTRTIAETNEITHTLPAGIGHLIRWDPGQLPGVYTIVSIDFVRNGNPTAIGPEGLSIPPELSESERITPSPGPGVATVDSEGPPQLIIDVGDTGPGSVPWLLPVTVVLALATAGGALILRRRKRWNTEVIAIGFVVWLYSTLLFYVVSLAPRIPFRDDWRYLDSLNAAGQLPVTPRSLLRPVNDTVYATGKFFDAVLLNSTRFSFLAVQVFGILLLGAFVVLAIVLIRRIGSRIEPRAVPYAIVLIGFALVANSYWIRAAVAYHHLIAVLLGIAIMLLLDSQSRRLWRSGLIAVLAVLAGMSYISGAVLLLIIGASYLVVCGHRGSNDGAARLRPLLPGLTLVAAGIATMAAQLYLVVRFQGSLFVSTAKFPTAYPWNPRFWAFLMGEAGRAVGFRDAPPLVLGMIAAVFLTTPVAVWLIIRRRPTGFDPYTSFVLLATSLVSPLYFGIVAYGRSTALGPDASLSEVVQHGGARFHFWWGAAMIPFIWLAWRGIAKQAPRSYRRAAATAVVVVTVLIAVPKTLADWRYPEALSGTAAMIQNDISCITTHLKLGESSFSCDLEGNIGPELAVAYQHGLAFIEQAGLPTLPTGDE